MLLSLSLEKELNDGTLVSEETDPVDTVLDSSVRAEVDGTSLSCEALERDSEAAEEPNDSLADVGLSVLPWLLRVEISAVLVDNSETAGVDVDSLLLLVPEKLAELSLAFSRLLDCEEEASRPLVGYCVEVAAEDSELSNALG